METGSSLLLYLYKGTITVQNKLIHQRQYYILNAAVEKVDLFLGSRKSLNSPWLSSQTVRSLNTSTPHVGLQSTPPIFKRIVRDFSLSLQTRSQNGFIPSRDIPSFNKDDLVNRITVSIGAFSIRMNGEEFYRFLNVVRYTLLANPTNSVILNREEEDKKKNMGKISSEMMKHIASRVEKLVKSATETELLPVLKIKYTLEEVEWTLLSVQQEQIAVATLRGFVGEHTFCFDGKSESKIILNDLRIINPSTNDVGWSSSEKVLDPVMIDRDHDAQSNILEIITVISNSFVCDGIPVSVFEHVGVNVFPGCHYYLLFQLTGTMANGIFRYFFPEDEADGGYESDEDDSRTVVSTEQDQAPAATLRTAQQPPKQDIILELSEDDSVDGSLSSEVSPVCLGASRNE